MTWRKRCLLIFYTGCVACVLAADIEDQAIAVAKNYAPVNNISAPDKQLIQEYLRQIGKEQRHLDSKGGSIDWKAAQRGLIELGDEEAINTILTMRSSPVFVERLAASDIMLGRSQPLFIPKLVSAVRLNQWKNERVEDIMLGGVSRSALYAVEGVLAKSAAFGEDVRQWAKRRPLSGQKQDQAAASFEAWWTQNQPHFEAKRYDLVRPLQDERVGAGYAARLRGLHGQRSGVRSAGH